MSKTEEVLAGLQEPTWKVPAETHDVLLKENAALHDKLAVAVEALEEIRNGREVREGFMEPPAAPFTTNQIRMIAKSALARIEGKGERG